MIPKDFNWRILMFVVVVILVFFAGVQYGSYYSDSDEPAISRVDREEDEEKPETDDRLIVHVAGAVFNPGVYELEPGSRVNKAVEEAGPLTDADLDGLNLAEPVRDGQKIHVYFAGEQETSNTEQETSASGRVNINSAGAAELQELPGVGPVLADRIVEYRNDEGYFTSPEELKDVSGIGDAIFSSLEDLITTY